MTILIFFAVILVAIILAIFLNRLVKCPWLIGLIFFFFFFSFKLDTVKTLSPSKPKDKSVANLIKLALDGLEV